MATWNQIVGPALDGGNADEVKKALDILNSLKAQGMAGDENLEYAVKQCEAFLAASPAAREHAASVGVDLAQVSGSGKDGQITKTDVQSVADGTPAPAPADNQAPSA